MRITVYVPCHNNEATLPEVLEALRKQSRPADQFLFIDDHCTDRSAAIAAERGFDVHALKGKRGLGAGRNRALELATGDILVGVDADVMVTPDYLEKMEGHFQSKPGIAAVGGRLNEKFTDTPADLWRAVHMMQHYGDRPVTNPRRLCGCTMAIRVALARKIGGWDERFASNFEDVDISRRLMSAGLTLLYVPDCVAWHLHRDTLETVLHNYWKWHYFGEEKSFCDLRTWLENRPNTIWMGYSFCRGEDRWTQQLSYITLLMPWSVLMRDVNALRATVPNAGNIAGIAGIAKQVLGSYGYDPQLISQLTQWLDGLAASIDAEAPKRGGLRGEIVDVVSFGAFSFIPNANYAQVCLRNAATVPGLQQTA